MQHDTITRLVIPIVETHTSFQPKPRVSEDGSLMYGFGFRYDDHGQPVCADTRPISRATALESLRTRLHTIIDAIEVSLAGRPVTPYQMAAMVDYAYDLGMEKFRSSGLTHATQSMNVSSARQFLMLGTYMRKNDRIMPSKTRTSRRRMACQLWDRQA